MRRNQELIDNITSEMENVWGKFLEHKAKGNLAMEYHWLELLKSLIDSRHQALGLNYPERAK